MVIFNITEHTFVFQFQHCFCCHLERTTTLILSRGILLIGDDLKYTRHPEISMKTNLELAPTHVNRTRGFVSLAARIVSAKTEQRTFISASTNYPRETCSSTKPSSQSWKSWRRSTTKKTVMRETRPPLHAKATGISSWRLRRAETQIRRGRKRRWNSR